MYGFKQPRGDGERYVTPARAAAKETKVPESSSHFCLLPVNPKVRGTVTFRILR